MATINDIGIPGVSSGILQPKIKNRWRVTFANMGGGTDSQPVSAQAITVTRPKLNFEEIPLHRYNSIAYVAAKHSWDDMQLTIQDDVTSAASQVIQAQLQSQQWIIGAEGQWLASAPEGALYKFVTYLDQLDGNDQVIEKWIIEGCWIKNTDFSDSDYAASEPVTITMTIRFDQAHQILGGYTAGQGNALGGSGNKNL